MAKIDWNSDSLEPKAEVQKPAAHLTKRQLEKIVTKKFEAKEEAMADALVIKQDSQWQDLRAYWLDADEDTRKNIVFGLGYNNGAKERDIARLFNIKKEDLKGYGDVLSQAVAALKMRVQSNQITIAFMSDQPMLKFFLGKQFAEQVDNPAHDGVKSDDTAGGMAINVFTKKVERDEQGNTIAKSTANEFDQKTSRTLQ